MYLKLFMRLFLSIGMIGLFSAIAFADEIQIGSGSQTDSNLPSHSYYKLEPSHVLRAMQVPFQFAHGSIRFSLSRYSTIEEVNKVLEVMPKIVSRLRALSPFNPSTFSAVK